MARADQRKYHYIYRVTRADESERYYIGMHSTDDLNDGYFGSGQLLAKSIKKHGKEKHIKKILEYLPSRVLLKSRERELVNEELLGDRLCMNLMLGGEGGGGIRNEKHFKAFCPKAGSDAVKVRNIKSAATQAKLCAEGSIIPPTFANRKHSEVSLAKMRASHAGQQAGKRNSQFGTCWVTKNGIHSKIKLTDLSAAISNGWRKGRKLEQ